jgi:hypothetical protein
MKEHDIRPQVIFDEYLRLTEEDTHTYFKHSVRNEICCPACGGKGSQAFTKSEFNYVECDACQTLYASPRPERAAFERYYTDSPSTKFWATTFYKKTEEARREKIWKPKAVLIKEKILQFAEATDIIDIGGGYGTFAEEIRRITDYMVTIIEPSRHLAEVCRSKGFRVVEKFLESMSVDDLDGNKRCFVSFELFEHLYDPANFLSILNGLMNEDDLFIFTTLSGTGADIQVLWEHSKAVSPPHHLNFFNPQSVQSLLTSCGYEMLEVTTPGKLDVNIIENNLAYSGDRFWKTFFKHATEKDKQDLQDYLSSHLMSSHMMVVCRRKLKGAENG